MGVCNGSPIGSPLLTPIQISRKVLFNMRFSRDMYQKFMSTDFVLKVICNSIV